MRLRGMQVGGRGWGGGWSQKKFDSDPVFDASCQPPFDASQSARRAASIVSSCTRPLAKCQARHRLYDGLQCSLGGRGLPQLLHGRGIPLPTNLASRDAQAT